MCQAGLDVFYQVGFAGFGFKIFLVVFIEIDKVGIVMPLPHGAVSGEVSLLAALETGSIGVLVRWSFVKVQDLLMARLVRFGCGVPSPQ